MRFSAPDNKSIGPDRDRRFWRALFFIDKYLIFSALLVLTSFSPIFGQKSNEERFFDALGSVLKSRQVKADSASGFLAEEIQAKFAIPKTDSVMLILEEPVVAYRKLEKNCFERKISSVLNLEGKVELGYQVLATDTLYDPDWKMIRKTEYPELKGTVPNFSSKYLWPAALIGTGIAGIISLFYLRSS